MSGQQYAVYRQTLGHWHRVSRIWDDAEPAIRYMHSLPRDWEMEVRGRPVLPQDEPE